MAEKGFVSAIVVAAGSSRRMGGINKLLLKIKGKEVLLRSVEAFEKNADTDEIIIAARREDIPLYAQLLSDCKKVKCIVPGGETRQQSVAAAVAACSKNSVMLAIHDGARPLVTQDVISRTVAAAFENGAAACGVHVKDTIKITDESGVITDTPDRANLWAVHTPQCFDKKMYESCVASLGESAKNMTDDCRLVEMSGGKVKMVEGLYSNIKITTAEDIPLAESLVEEG